MKEVAKCRTVEKRISRYAWGGACFVFAFALAGSMSQLAAAVPAPADPADCSGTQAEIGLSLTDPTSGAAITPLVVLNGQTVNVNVQFRNTGCTGCTVNNVVINGFCPGSAVAAATFNSGNVPPLASVKGSGTTNPDSTPCTPATATGTDLGTIGVYPCTITASQNPCPGPAATATPNAAATFILQDGNDDPQSAAKSISVTVKHPSIAVTKNCVLDATSTPDHPVILISGTVTNTGDETLNVTSLTDNKAGPIAIPPGINPLACGGTFNYSKTYSPTTCSPFPDTVTVSANTVTQFFVNGVKAVQPVTNTANCSVPCTVSPGLAIENAICAIPATSIGGTSTVTGILHNTGNTALFSLTITDGAGVNCGLTPPVASLAPGATAPFTCTFIQNTCSQAITLNASGVSHSPCCAASCTNGVGNCVVNATPVTSTPCVITPVARLSVTKTCVANGDPNNPLITISGQVCASSGGVNSDVALDNVLLVDAPPANFDVTPPTHLAAGQCAPYHGTYVPTNCVSPDTVTATATAAPCDSVTVANPPPATASCSASIPCTPAISVTKTCHGNNNADSPEITFSGQVCNTGNVTLVNVSVVDDKGGVSVPSATTLPPGACSPYSGSYIPTECSSTDTVTATGTSSSGLQCADPACNGATVTAQASCTATFTCNPAITVTKACQDATAAGDPITFSGTVKNTGNVTLINVTVTDSVVGALTCGTGTLAPNATCTYSGSYIPADCGVDQTDTVTAAGDAGSGLACCKDAAGAAKHVSATASATCSCAIFGCRMTGGGNQNSSPWPWDGTFADGKAKVTKQNGTTGEDYFTHGGQIGAPSARPVDIGSKHGPFGEWTHVQHNGPDNSFTFHSGTSSAPEEARIISIVCSDPGWCSPARKAPDRQIDWEGTGVFKNHKGTLANGIEVVDQTKIYYYTAHVEDLGEPGSKFANKAASGDATCPIGGHPGGIAAFPNECDCADYYTITIYEGPNAANKGNVIYAVRAYLRGGNHQIHPEIGSKK